MSRTQILEKLQSGFLMKNRPAFNVGDTLSVNLRILEEGESKKERIQTFTGTVIAKKGCGASETFTLYRHAYGCNMERVFFLHSPRISSIEVVSSGQVSRAKLYYLRGASGKAAKIKRKSAFRYAEELAKDMLAAPAQDQPTAES